MSILARASASDLEDLVYGEVNPDIHLISMNEAGSEFLKSLFSRIRELCLPLLTSSIFAAFTMNEKRFLSVILDPVFGCDTFFSLFHTFGYEKTDYMILQIVPMVEKRLIDEMNRFVVAEACFQKLFHHLCLLGLSLEPILAKLARNFGLLSKSKSVTGFKSLEKMFFSSTTEVQTSFLNMLDLVSVSCTPKGNLFVQSALALHSISKLILEKLSEKLVYLSTDTYGNHVLQKAIFHGDSELIDMILYEISQSLDFLLYHRFGNYVLQGMLRKLKRMNLLQFKLLESYVFSRAAFLSHDRWGSQVLCSWRVAEDINRFVYRVYRKFGIEYRILGIYTLDQFEFGVESSKTRLNNSQFWLYIEFIESLSLVCSIGIYLGSL